MGLKRHLLHGLIAGGLAATACLLYLGIYKEALGVNYARIVNPVSIIGSCLFGCTLMALAYALLRKTRYRSAIGILNIIISVLSFVSIIGPISMTLPIDTANPELFPGLVIPMHFFPALAFFTVIPFFTKSSNNDQ